MIILHLGLPVSLEFSALWTWILLAVPVVLCLALRTRSTWFAVLGKYVRSHFTIIWYFLIVGIFTCLTISNFASINYKDITFGTVIATMLIILLVLPFFKRISAFGVEAEISSLETANTLERQVTALGMQANFTAKEQALHTGTEEKQQTQEQLDMLHRLEALKTEVGEQ